MQASPPTTTFVAFMPRFATVDHHFGGDQSPLNDADADEDNDPEGYLDLEILGLDEFIDADKLDPSITGDIGSSILG